MIHGSCSSHVRGFPAALFVYLTKSVWSTGSIHDIKDSIVRQVLEPTSTKLGDFKLLESNRRVSFHTPVRHLSSWLPLYFSSSTQ